MTESWKIGYERAKEMARDENPDIRKEIAGRTDVMPEILFFLANDPSPEVRRTLAANRAAPRRADLVLARDADPMVRSDVARKIADSREDVTLDDETRIGRLTYEALSLLAGDHVTRVRQALSEALKTVANAPPDVIKRLARDVEIVVAGPVLEFSPVLSDTDLIEIIAERPSAGQGLAAIARRANLSAAVSDAVVATDDVGAVAVLLGNGSAQIREETLDYIIDRAPTIEPWHRPLVGRPTLSSRAVERLSQFVADNLLEVLAVREGLDPEVSRSIQEEVHRRLKEPKPEPADVPPAPDPQAEERTLKKLLERRLGENVFALAKRLYRNRRLDSEIITKALDLGDRDFVGAALAVLANFPPESVERILSQHSARGVVSLAWRARMPASLLPRFQRELANVPEGEILTVDRGGKFPLTAEEMTWQLEFFRRLNS